MGHSCAYAWKYTETMQITGLLKKKKKRNVEVVNRCTFFLIYNTIKSLKGNKMLL